MQVLQRKKQKKRRKIKLLPLKQRRSIFFENSKYETEKKYNRDIFPDSKPEDIVVET